jgi:type I restriction enzyme S subunit
MSEAAHIPQLRFPEYSANWSQRLLSDFLIPTLREIEKPKVNYLAIGLRSHCKGTFQKPDSDPSKIAMEKLFRVKENDLIVNITFAWEGAIAIVKENDEGGLVSHRFPTYTFDTNITSHHFFKHQFINKRFRYLLDLISPGGAGRNRVMSKKEFVKLKVPLPSVGEQQKIAAFLTAVDNKIEQLSKKQALLGSWKKGLMQQIFSQAIRFKADDGSAFPVWEEKNIVELAKTSIGLVTSMTPYYVDKGVPLIRNNDIFQNKIRKEKLIRLDYEFDQLNKNRRLFTNDIVTVHTGNIGASAVIDEELNGCQGFATLNTRIKNQNEISSSFLCWYYNSTRNIKYALSMATGDGRSNYNLKDFNKATIPVPSLPEQTKIAAFLTAADNKIEQVGKQFDESKQFKKALLQQMFV